MGKITTDTFNPIKAFCNVRLQQGVPLVDADVNELDDIRKFEVRAFLKWFVGDGVPDGNDGFRIASYTPPGTTTGGTGTSATPATDDFVISAGSQLSGAAPAGPSTATNEFVLQNFGRCIVDGLDVIIPAAVNYKAQPLFDPSQAALLGVPVIAPLPPNVSGPWTVYLDIWEHPVDAATDPSIVVSSLGVETCERIKREWVVRTRKGIGIPTSTQTDFIANHAYYALATINRQVDANGNSIGIAPGALIDEREQGLLIPPGYLVQDVVGLSIGSVPLSANDYRRGLGRPPVSLRDAINGIVRGELPGTSGQQLGVPVGTNNSYISYGSFVDDADGLVTVWHTDQNAILGARLDLSNPRSGFAEPVAIVPNGAGISGLSPHAALLPTSDGQLLVVYASPNSFGGSPAGIAFTRASDLSDFPASPASTSVVALTGSVTNVRPFAVVSPSGSSRNPALPWVIFFWFQSQSGQTVDAWYCRRRQYGASWSESDPSTVWLDQQPVELGPPGVDNNARGTFHAVADSFGRVWVAWTEQLKQTTGQQLYSVVVNTIDNTGAVALQALPLTASSFPISTTQTPNPPAPSVFLLADNQRDVLWVFFSTAVGIYCGTCSTAPASQFTQTMLIPASTSTAPNAAPFLTACQDDRGVVWLFWSNYAPPIAAAAGAVPSSAIVAAYCDPRTGMWSAPVPVVPDFGTRDSFPVAVAGTSSSLWLLWQRATGAAGQNRNVIQYRELFSAI